MGEGTPIEILPRDPATLAPPAGSALATKIPVQTSIEHCPGLEIWDAENQTGNSVCFVSTEALDPTRPTMIDLKDLQHYVDCGNGFCYQGNWAGAVRSLRVGDEPVTLASYHAADHMGATDPSAKSESMVYHRLDDGIEPRLGDVSTVKSISWGPPDTK